MVGRAIRFPIKVVEGLLLDVKVGEKVMEGQVVGHYGWEKELEISLSPLGIKGSGLAKAMVVGVGQVVAKGEVIARSKGLLAKREVVAPVAGAVQSLVGERGVVVLRVPSQEARGVISPVSGMVVEVGSERLVIEAKGREFPVTTGFGDVVWGRLEVVGKGGLSVFDALSAEAEGKIVLTAEPAGEVWLTKAAALGVAGVVCPGGKDVGGAGLSLTVMTVPAEGGGRADQSLWAELSRHEGSLVVLDPQEKFLGLVE